MGKTFNMLFNEMRKDKAVIYPTYSNDGGHILLGGATMGCIFTIVADTPGAASLSVSGENTELIISGLRDEITSIIGAEPLCQYDVHSKREMHVVEWYIADETGVADYLKDLVNGGGNYFYLDQKDNLELFNGHNPQEYTSAERAAELQAAYQQYCHDIWCEFHRVEDFTPRTGQPFVTELDLSMTKYATRAASH